MRILAALLLAPVVLAAAPADGLRLEGRAEQGGIMRGQVPAGTTLLTLDGKPVRIDPDRRFIIGFGRDSGPLATLVWTVHDTPVSRPLDIAPRQWRIQSLPNLPPRPVPDAEFEARRPGELAKIGAARGASGESRGWRGVFIAPAKGIVSGV